jgi:hypothetical protein
MLQKMSGWGGESAKSGWIGSPPIVKNCAKAKSIANRSEIQRRSIFEV